MDMKRELEIRTKQIEGMMDPFLPQETGYQKSVLEAMNYSFLAGGKRIRPMLMYETYQMFGGKSAIIEPFMAAIEMIHTYSLIHDDLPAMDNDEFRRGRKTTHIVYGEAMAILAGDGLLNLAYETMIQALVQNPESSQHVIKAMAIIAKSAGIYGMIGGQTVDVENEGIAVTKDKLDFIYALKTGALIEASMMAGAILAGATFNEQEVIRSVSKKVGLAFQIQDDILDVTSSLEVLGKPVGSDEKNDKSTYVTLEGIEKAKQDVERLTEEAVSLMDSLVVRNEFLNNLLLYMICREK